MTDGWTLSQLVASVERISEGRVPATVRGDAARRIMSVATLAAAEANHLAFLANGRYRTQARASRAGAIVLSGRDAEALFADATTTAAALIVCEQAYAWYAFAAQILAPTQTTAPGVAAEACVASDATVAASARIDAGAVVASGAQIGERCWLGAGAYVGEQARVGADSRLHPGARLLAQCTIGARAIVHSGAVIGADGFGFAPLDGRWLKIPQIGRVVIGDDVEIGANTTIDRGALDDTVIEDGVKIDNQVQIAHNCRIGAHSAIAGCAGIAGSAVIGRGCQIGGAAMIHGHIEIADGVIVSAGTLISRSISEPGFYTGVFPFMRNREWEHNAAALRHLDELRDRVRKLEARARSEADDKPAADSKPADGRDDGRS